MRLRHLVVATTAVVLAATLTAHPAEARNPGDERAPAPGVSYLRSGDHLPATVTTNVPANGTSLVTTPTLPKNLTTLTLEYEIESKDAAALDAFEKFNSSMAQLSKGKRLMVCVMMYQAVAAPYSPVGDEARVDAYNITNAGALLLACLKIAGLISDGPPMARATATQRCAQLMPSLPVTTTKVDGGYSVVAEGTITKAKKPKIKVKCRSSATKVTLKIKPRKKGKTLRQVVGKKLMVGIKSPPDAGTTVPVKMTFSR